MGDVVKLTISMACVNERDAMNRLYVTASSVRPSMRSGETIDRTLYGAHAGVYLGTEYVTVHDARALTRMRQKLCHSFFFGGQRIFIDPNFVEVVSRFADAC